jgi:uncharacterized protein (DUF362 family)/ferredoxin
VSASQVALIRCESYDPEEVFRAVGRGFDLLGGAERFARPSERIVLKPNLLVPSAPEDCVTTNPAVFAAAARHLAAAGAALSYGDSPAFGPTRSAARKAGILDEAERLGVSRADFSTARTVSFPEGGLIKQFDIAASVLDADGLVSLPKMKTHGLVRVTGAVKNQFGCIPGVRKGAFHARLADAQWFSRMLVDLNLLLRPRLLIMDGIMAMEGNGPRGGDPRAMNAVLMSTDPVALDTVFCHMIDLDPLLVGTIDWGVRSGLGQADDIQVLGDRLDEFHTPDFAVNRSPASTTGGTSWRSRAVRDRIVPRPVIDHESCTACGTCVRMCPVDPKAVLFERGDPLTGKIPGEDPAGRAKEPPSHDYSRCIRCYCCQEVCPEHAITIRTPLLGRMINR